MASSSRRCRCCSSPYSDCIVSSFIMATRRSTAACSRSLRSFSISASRCRMSPSSAASRWAACSACSLCTVASRSHRSDSWRISVASVCALAARIRSRCSSLSRSTSWLCTASSVPFLSCRSLLSDATVSCSCFISATVALFRCEERPAAVNNPGSLSEVELSSSAAAPDVGELSDAVGPPAGPFFCRSRAEELESPVTEIDMLRLRDKSRLRSTALRIAFRLSVDSDPIRSLFRSSESRKPASSSSRCVEIAHRSAYSLRHFWAFSASSRAAISSSFSCLMMMLRSFRWSPAPPLPHSLWISVSFFCCSSFARCTSASYSAWLTGLRSWSTISGTASAGTPARAPVAPPFMPCSE
uniref:Uncharacterized protein n=1 Tax=Anopheles melas TaxID=34690 RepID=A0A182TVZ7_9DIPT